MPSGLTPNGEQKMKLYRSYDHSRGMDGMATPWRKEWDAVEVAGSIRKIEVEGRPEEWYEYRAGEWRLSPGALRP